MRLFNWSRQTLRSRGVVYFFWMAVVYAIPENLERLKMKFRMAYYKVLCGAVGQGVTIDKGTEITIPSNFFIGNHSSLSKGCYVVCGDKVHIGDYVIIGPMTMMFTQNHVFGDLNTPMKNQGAQFSPIVIEDDVWVGAGCTILAGVHIGTGAIIGAGAVVADDIPPYAIALGVPAEIKRLRRETKTVLTTFGSITKVQPIARR